MSGEAVVLDMMGSTLQAYLLGAVDFDSVLLLQLRLVYEVAGNRTTAALILCEHPPIITVGRDGSREHIRYETRELVTRGWPIRWVNRGGGCLLQTAGQIAAYPVLALDRRRLDLSAYLDRLHAAVIDALAAFDVTGETVAGRSGVFVQGRLIAHVGVAVRDWTAYFGVALNVNPDLEPFRRVHCAGPGDSPMTSLERERRGMIRPGTVRQQIIESFAAQFGFERISPFHSHPALTIPVPSHGVAVRPA